MQYNLKAVSYEEAYYFKKYHIPLKGWLGSQDRIIVKDIKTRKGVLTFVILPWDISALDESPQKEILASLEKRKSLIIGISPYGYAEEQDILDQYPPHVFDILLGSGRGPIFPGQVREKTLWIRPLSKGKAVYIITIKDIRDIKAKGPILGKNIEVKKKFITQDIVPDKKITAIFKEENREE